MKQRNRKRFLLVAALILALALLLVACKTRDTGDGGKNPDISNEPSSTGRATPGETGESIPSQPGESEGENISSQPGESEGQEIPSQPGEEEGENDPTQPDGGWIDENEED